MAALTDTRPTTTRAIISQQSGNNASTRILLIALAIIGGAALTVGLLGLFGKSPIRRILGNAGCVAGTGVGGSVLLIATALQACQASKRAKIAINDTLTTHTTYRYVTDHQDCGQHAFSLPEAEIELRDPDGNTVSFPVGAGSFLEFRNGSVVAIESALYGPEIKLLVQNRQGDWLVDEAVLQRLKERYAQYEANMRVIGYKEDKLILPGIEIPLENRDGKNYLPNSSINRIGHDGLNADLESYWTQVVWNSVVKSPQAAAKILSKTSSSPKYAIMQGPSGISYLCIGLLHQIQIFAIEEEKINGKPFALSPDGTKPKDFINLAGFDNPLFELKYRCQEGVDGKPGEFYYQTAPGASHLHIQTFNNQYIFINVSDEEDPFNMELIIEDGKLILPTNAYCDRLVVGQIRNNQLTLNLAGVEELSQHYAAYMKTCQLIELYEDNEPPQITVGGKITLYLGPTIDKGGYSFGDRQILNEEGCVDHLALHDVLKEVWKKVDIIDKVDTLKDAADCVAKQVETPYFAILKDRRDNPAYLVLGFSNLPAYVYSIQEDQGKYTIQGIPFEISEDQPANLFRLMQLGLPDFVDSSNPPIISQDMAELDVPNLSSGTQTNEGLVRGTSAQYQHLEKDVAILKPGEFVYNQQRLAVRTPDDKLIVIAVHNEPNPFGLNLIVADNALHLPADMYGPPLCIGTFDANNQLTLSPQEIEALWLRQAEYSKVNLEIALHATPDGMQLVLPGNLSLELTRQDNNCFILSNRIVIDQFGAVNHTALNQSLKNVWDKVVCTIKVDSPEAAAQHFVPQSNRTSYAIMSNNTDQPAYLVICLPNRYTYIYPIVTDGENFTINNIPFSIRDGKPQNFITLGGFGDPSLMLDSKGDPIAPLPTMRTIVPIKMTQDENFETRLINSFRASLTDPNVFGLVPLDKVDDKGNQAFLGFRTRKPIPYRVPEGDCIIFPVMKDRTVQALYQKADGVFYFAPTSNESQDFPVVEDNKLIEEAAQQMLTSNNDFLLRQMAERDFPTQSTMRENTLEDIAATIEMEAINTGNSWRLVIADGIVHIVVAFDKQLLIAPAPLRAANSLTQFSLIPGSDSKLEIFYGNRLFAQNISESTPTRTIHTGAVLREITNRNVTSTKISGAICKDRMEAEMMMPSGTFAVSPDRKELYFKTGEGLTFTIMAATVPTIGRIWFNPLDRQFYYITRSRMVALRGEKLRDKINFISIKHTELENTKLSGTKPAYIISVVEDQQKICLICNECTVQIPLSSEIRQPTTFFWNNESQKYQYTTLGGEAIVLTEDSIGLIFNQVLIDAGKTLSVV